MADRTKAHSKVDDEKAKIGSVVGEELPDSSVHPDPLRWTADLPPRSAVLCIDNLFPPVTLS